MAKHIDHRCRDCKWWCGKQSSIGRECMNPELQRKWSGRYRNETARYKAPTTPACKGHFEPRTEVEEQ